MKLTAFFFTALLSTSVFSATDFNCKGKIPAKSIEVSYINGDLSYNDGRNIDVSVNDETLAGKVLTVAGVSRGLVFAGGGTQTVNVSVNLKTKNGAITIKTATFYRKTETTYKLSCTL